MRRKRRVRARLRALIMSWEITFLGPPFGLPTVHEIHRPG
jgi:hypothetical protein